MQGALSETYLDKESGNLEDVLRNILLKISRRKEEFKNVRDVKHL